MLSPDSCSCVGFWGWVRRTESDHGVKCVLGGPEGSWELWKKEGIEQAGPRVSRASRGGVSGQKPLTMGAAEMAGNLPRKAGSSPPNTPGWPGSGCQPEGSDYTLPYWSQAS